MKSFSRYLVIASSLLGTIGAGLMFGFSKPSTMALANLGKALEIAACVSLLFGLIGLIAGSFVPPQNGGTQ